MEIKSYISELGAKYINTNALHGVHWYSFIGDNYKLEEVNRLEQLIIQENQLTKDYLTVKKVGQKTNIIIFNPDYYSKIANHILDSVYKKYPELPKLKKPIDIQQLKKNEIQKFKEFILSLKTKNKVDIFLYKTFGPKEKTFILKEKENTYKKVIQGFYLVEEDFKQINEELSKVGKKIASLEQRDIIDLELGVRYLIEITDADFIEKR